MTKALVFSLLLALTGSCGSSASKQDNGTATQEAPAATETVQEEAEPQVEEEQTTAPVVQNSMLLGEIEKQDFLSPPFDSWFNSNYDSYTPDHALVETIKKEIQDVDKIRIYMGTWCPDSKREVPHFFRLLEEVDYDLNNVEMVAVDRSKTAPDNSQELYQVQRVPTLIFYKNGEEIGRYVEYPRETLEKDVAKIVSGQEYKHSYEN